MPEELRASRIGPTGHREMFVPTTNQESLNFIVGKALLSLIYRPELDHSVVLFPDPIVVATRHVAPYFPTNIDIAQAMASYYLRLSSRHAPDCIKSTPRTLVFGQVTEWTFGMHLSLRSMHYWDVSSSAHQMGISS